MGSKLTKQNRYKRPKGQQRRRWWKGGLAAMAKLFLGIILLMGASLAFILGHDVLLRHDYFRAERLTLAGCGRLSRQEVIAQTELKPGVNTLAVNLSVTREMLMSHPWIADAKVRREFPAALHVRIREEQPLAIVSMDRPWLINTDGKIFKEATQAEATGLPVVRGLTYLDIPVSGTPASDAFKAVMAVLDLGRQPHSAIPNRQIDQISVDREVGLTITAFGGGKTIRIGYGDYPRKYSQLRQLMHHLNRQGQFADFIAIDLSSTDRIVATPAPTHSPDAEGQEV